MVDEKKPDAKPEAKPEKKEVAEKKTLTNDPFIEVISYIFLIIVVLSLINGIGGIFTKGSPLGGGGFSMKNFLLPGSRPVSSLDNPIGATFIVSSGSAPLYSEPGGKQIATKHFGDKGEVIGGPVTLGGNKYWQVKFDDGSTGWMKDDDVVNMPNKVTPMRDVNSLTNGPVQTSKETPIFDETGKNQIGTEKAGGTGTIVDGPRVIDGKKYWHVKFDDGKEGLVPEENLSYLKQDKTPLTETTESLGTTVATSKDKTPVYDSPGGKQIATEPVNMKGKVTGSPETVNGVKYWPVKFDDGTTGWVKESDIGPYVPVGTVVATSKDGTPVYDSAGGKQIDTEPANMHGKVTGSPKTVAGVRYWPVTFDDGTKGWVRGSDLNAVVPNSTSVSASKDKTPIYDSPGGTQIATEPAKAKGKVIGGPEVVDGVKYWQVRFDDGTTGWVKEGDLDSIVSKPVPLASMPSAIGGKVTTADDGTAVLDSPGGKQIATEKYGTKGKIIEGPVIKDGKKYWHIKFENGDDGWVEENSLVYIEDSQLGLLAHLYMFFWKLIAFMKYFIWFICVLLVAWIVYLWRGLTNIRRKEAVALYPEIKAIPTYTNPHWERILNHIESTNENDWRLAILEADIMLDGLLDKLQLLGDTMGDKLKAVEKSDFTTIDNAWEAHKIRNQIAHDGLVFPMTQREARRVIELYRLVFEEFQII